MGLYPQAVVGGYCYTALFCEENIWQLVRALVAEGVDVASLQVIMVSNPQRQVVLFQQRNANEQNYVVWDYHVILRQRDGEGDRIYDFDSQLPFSCDSRVYLESTFGRQQTLQPSYRALLRLIPAADYLNNLYSDRHHMHGVVGEECFPSWPAITPLHEHTVRLEEYWDMQRAGIANSRVLSIEDFLRAEL